MSACDADLPVPRGNVAIEVAGPSAKDTGELESKPQEMSSHENPAPPEIKVTEEGKIVTKNEAHGFEKVEFTGAGINVTPADNADGGDWEFGYKLARIGRENALVELRDVQPTLEGEKAEYDFGGLVETYENTAEGIEQKMYIREKVYSGGPLIVEGDVTGSFEAIERDGGIVFRVGGAEVLSYHSLRVFDRNGDELDSSIEFSIGILRLVIDDSNAVYPLLVDPLLSAPGVWNFSTPADFVYSAGIEIVGGYAQLAPLTSPTWYDTAWPYRQPVTIDATANSADLTDYQVTIDVDSSNADFWANVETTGFDVRFTDEDGTTVLTYFRDSWNYAGQTAKFFVKVPSIPVATTKDILMYYGNASAGDVSDDAGTFDFIDNFSGASLDAGTWTATGSASVSGGLLTVTTGCVYSNSAIGNQPGEIVETRICWTGASASYAGLCIADDNATAGGNGGSDALIYFMNNASSLSVNCWAANGLAASYNVASGPAQFTAVLDTYYVISEAVSSTSVSLRKDYALTNSYSGTFSSTYFVWLGYFTGSVAGATNGWDINVDWIRTRASADSDPTATFGAEQGLSFPTTNPMIGAAAGNGIPYSDLIGFTENLGPSHNVAAGIEYQLSPNNSNWYYWNGSAWTEDLTPLSVTWSSETSSASEIDANAASFDDVAGSGTLYFRALLRSPTGVELAQLDGLDVYGSSPPATPAISTVTPASGYSGISVTIDGSGFGATQGLSTVTFDGENSGMVSAWSDTQITVDAPLNVTTGSVLVKVGGYISNADKTFTANAPTISSLTPSTAYFGEVVVIEGTNFGNAKGSSFVTFPNSKTAQTISWSNTSILAYVPSGTTTGNVTVTTAGGGTSATAGAGDDFTIAPDSSTWPFTVAGNYTISDPAALEITGGMAQLIPSYSDWYDTSWKWRIPVTIDNTATASTLTDHQVKVTLTSAATSFWAKVNADGSDIRFTDSDGVTPIYHYTSSFSYGANTATLWIKVPSIPASSNHTVYLYFDNDGASDASSMQDVFIFADDFEDASLDGSVWTATGTATEASGVLSVQTGSVYTDSTIGSQTNQLVEARIRWDATSASYAGLCIADAQSTAGGNSASDALVYFMSNAGSLSVNCWAANGAAASYNVTSGPAQFTASAGTYYEVGTVVTGTNVILFKDGAQSNTYAGTWSSPYYLWLGYFTGSASGGNDVRNIDVDWVRVRSYTPTQPGASVGTEQQLLYPDTVPYLTNDTGLPYLSVISISDSYGPDNEGTVQYQFSNDNTDWYYIDGTTWVKDTNPFVVEYDTETSLASEFGDYLGNAPQALQDGGTVYFRAYFYSDGTEFTQLDGVTVIPIDIDYTSSSLTPASVTQGDTGVAFTIEVTNGDAGAYTLTANSFLTFTDGTQTVVAYLDKVAGNYQDLDPATPTTLTFSSASNDGLGGGVSIPTGISPQDYEPEIRLFTTAIPNIRLDVADEVNVAPLFLYPIINSLSPSTGSSGVEVTISGVNFGATQGASTIYFNGVDAGAATTWSDTQVKINAPANVRTGSVVMIVGGLTSNTNKVFTVGAPTVSALTPSMAYYNDNVTIAGTNFGATQGLSWVTFPSGLLGAVNSWSNTSISVVVPGGAVTGDVTVTTVGGGESSTSGAGNDFALAPDNSSWPFTTSGDYNFSNSSEVEIISGAAQLKPTTSPTWYNGAWLCRQPVTLDATLSASSLTDFQIELTIDSSNADFWAGVQSTGYDIRVTDSDGYTLLDYFRETWNYAGQSATLWVKVPSIPNSSTKDIILYYDNAAAGDVSDATQVFDFYDGFDLGSLDTGTWTQTGTASVASGYLTVNTGAVHTNATELSQPGKLVEASIAWNATSASYAGLCIADGPSTQGGNAGANAHVYLMSNSASLAITSWAGNGQATGYNIVSGASQFTAVAGTFYDVGFTVTSSNTTYFQNGSQTGSYSGTFTENCYLWLGYFIGSTSGATDGRDIDVDWVRVRAYDANTPGATFGAEQVVSYPTTDPFVYPNTSAGLPFGELTSFAQVTGVSHDPSASIEYQLSSNGTYWYYWNGSAWTEDVSPGAVTFGTETCTAAEIDANAESFDDVAGQGTLYFRAVLHSPAGSELASLDSVDVTFTPPANPPTMSGISPASGASGTSVTISGANFGTEQGTSTITFAGSASGAVTFWSDTLVAVNAPLNVTTGAIVLTKNGINTSLNPTFTVLAPSVTSLSPSTAYYNESVIVTGTNFGDARGLSDVTFPGGYVADVVSWTSTAITVLVPEGTTSGDVTVTTVGGGTSSTAGTGNDFTISPDNSTWPFTVAGNYTLSGGGADIEVSGGMLQLKPSVSNWFNGSFSSRMPVDIDNTGNASTLTDYQVKVTLSSSDADFWAAVDSAGADIRFCDSDGTTPVDYYRDSWNYAGESATLWVNVPSIAGSSNHTIYMYFGYGSATDTSSIDDTFVFGDDFNSGSLDGSKWTATGTASVSSGVLTVSTGSVYTPSTVGNEPGEIVEARMCWTGSSASYAGLIVSDDVATAGGNGGSDAFVYFMNNASSLSINCWAANGAAASYNVASGPAQFTAVIDTYYELANIVTGTNMILRKDGVQTNSYAGTFTAPTYVWLGYFTGSAAGGTNGWDVKVDWVRVREYTTVEPSATVGAMENITYPTSVPYATPTTGISYSNIVSFTDVDGPSNEGQIEYQVSPDDGTTWYYLSGATWTEDLTPASVTFGTETSTDSEINANAQTFNDAPLPASGTFRFRAFLYSDGSEFTQLDGVTMVAIDINATASSLSPTSVQDNTPNVSFSIEMANDGASAVTLTSSSYLSFTDGAKTYKAYVDREGAPYPTLNPGVPKTIVFGSPTTSGNGGGVTVPAGITGQAYTPDIRLYSASWSNVPLATTDQVTVITSQAGLWNVDATSTNWFTATNWDSNTVPATSDNIVIPSGAAFYPVVTSDVTNVIGDLTIEAGASLTLSDGVLLKMSGAASIQGTLSVSGTSGNEAALLKNGGGQIVFTIGANAVIEFVSASNNEAGAHFTSYKFTGGGSNADVDFSDCLFDSFQTGWSAYVEFAAGFLGKTIEVASTSFGNSGNVQNAKNIKVVSAGSPRVHAIASTGTLAGEEFDDDASERVRWYGAAQSFNNVSTGTDYQTFASALAAASAGDVIRPLTNIPFAENVSVNKAIVMEGFVVIGNVDASVSNVTLQNSFVVGNVGSTGALENVLHCSVSGSITANGSTGTASYNIATGAISGANTSGNIVDASAGTNHWVNLSALDMHLRATSSAIDSAGGSTIVLDFDGETRGVIDGTPDAGADEFDSGSSVGSVIWEQDNRAGINGIGPVNNVYSDFSGTDLTWLATSALDNVTPRWQNALVALDTYSGSVVAGIRGAISATATNAGFTNGFMTFGGAVSFVNVLRVNAGAYDIYVGYDSNSDGRCDTIRKIRAPYSGTLSPANRPTWASATIEWTFSVSEGPLSLASFGFSAGVWDVFVIADGDSARTGNSNPVVHKINNDPGAGASYGTLSASSQRGSAPHYDYRHGLLALWSGGFTATLEANNPSDPDLVRLDNDLATISTHDVGVNGMGAAPKPGTTGTSNVWIAEDGTDQFYGVDVSGPSNITNFDPFDLSANSITSGGSAIISHTPRSMFNTPWIHGAYSENSRSFVFKVSESDGSTDSDWQDAGRLELDGTILPGSLWYDRLDSHLFAATVDGHLYSILCPNTAAGVGDDGTMRAGYPIRIADAQIRRVNYVLHGTNNLGIVQLENGRIVAMKLR
ncbi:MAG: DUF2341 domain-containing protein [Planctomycetes bacterium]|nr:DUF2341 domain-containing protein [Planctomycetota bacterium]